MRLLAGFGIYERLLLCSALVLNKEFEEALQEYRCLKVRIIEIVPTYALAFAFVRWMTINPN